MPQRDRQAIQRALMTEADAAGGNQQQNRPIPIPVPGHALRRALRKIQLRMPVAEIMVNSTPGQEYQLRAKRDRDANMPPRRPATR